MSAIEKGDGPNGPTYTMLKRVARACGVTFDVQATAGPFSPSPSSVSDKAMNV